MTNHKAVAAKRAHASTLITAPMTNPLMAFWPPWRFGSNIKSADETRIEVLSEGAIIAEWCFAAIVVFGVGGEFFIAARHPVYDSWLGWWGIAYADLMVGIGVAGEVFASMVSHLCQSELTLRSNKKLETAYDLAFMASNAAESAQRELTTTTERAIRAELALIEFRKKRRDVLLSNRPVLLAQITPFSGTRFDIGVTPGSREQADFVWEFTHTLIGAGWIFANWVPAPGVQPLTQGLTISQGSFVQGSVVASNVEVHLNPVAALTLGSAATALVSCLMGIGISAEIAPFNVHNANDPDVMHILIGDKT